MEFALIVFAWYAAGWVGSALFIYLFYRDFERIIVGDLVIGAIFAVFGQLGLAASLIVLFF